MNNLLKTRKTAITITVGIVAMVLTVTIGLLVTRGSSVAAPEKIADPAADTGRPAPTTTVVEPAAPEVSPEDEARLYEYLAALEAAQQADAPQPTPPPPAAPPVGPTRAEDIGQGSIEPAPVSPDATVPDNQPLPTPPVPEGNYGLPSNPFSHPSASYIAEIDRRPGVRHYYYNVPTDMAQACSVAQSMLTAAGYTLGFVGCNGGVTISFYGNGIGGDASVVVAGQLTIELRA